MAKVLIVGAGAGGMVTGYHLALSGAEVTFFVRPARMEQLSVPQSLYCYDDCQIKTYEGFGLICDIADVREQGFDYILVTLDGHAAQTPEGSELLRQLGQAIVDTQAVMFNLGVGFEIKQHYLAMTGLPANRVVCGSFNFLSHFVAGNDLRLHAPVTEDHLAQASIAYRHVNGLVGLLIEDIKTPQVKRFVGLYGTSGISVCNTAGPAVIELMANLLFPVFAIFELANWADAPAVVSNKPLWRLGCKAMSEIAVLPRYGVAGKIVSLLITPWVWGKIWLKLEKTSLPLDFTHFNRLHHGDKVKEQDTEILQANLNYGRSLGRNMPNLQELLTQLAAKRQKVKVG